MKNKLTYSVVGVLLLLIVVGGGLWYKNYTEKEYILDENNEELIPYLYMKK